MQRHYHITWKTNLASHCDIWVLEAWRFESYWTTFKLSKNLRNLHGGKESQMAQLVRNNALFARVREQKHSWKERNVQQPSLPLKCSKLNQVCSRDVPTWWSPDGTCAILPPHHVEFTYTQFMFELILDREDQYLEETCWARKRQGSR